MTEIDYDRQMAESAADFVHDCLMHVHRGVLDCGDKFVIFGNDGYELEGRVGREVQLIEEKLRRYEVDKPIFGTNDNGYSWTLIVPNYQRYDIDRDILLEMVTDAWIQVCGDTKEGK